MLPKHEEKIHIQRIVSSVHEMFNLENGEKIKTEGFASMNPSTKILKSGEMKIWDMRSPGLPKKNLQRKYEEPNASCIHDPPKYEELGFLKRSQSFLSAHCIFFLEDHQHLSDFSSCPTLLYQIHLVESQQGYCLELLVLQLLLALAHLALAQYWKSAALANTLVQRALEPWETQA